MRAVSTRAIFLKVTRRDRSANTLSVARSTGDHALSYTKTGLPCLNRRMPGRQAGKPPFNLSDLSLGCIKFGGCWCRLDISPRMRAGAPLALSHGRGDGLRCWPSSMRE